MVIENIANENCSDNMYASLSIYLTNGCEVCIHKTWWAYALSSTIHLKNEANADFVYNMYLFYYY